MRDLINESALRPFSAHIFEGKMPLNVFILETTIRGILGIIGFDIGMLRLRYSLLYLIRDLKELLGLDPTQDRPYTRCVISIS